MTTNEFAKFINGKEIELLDCSIFNVTDSNFDMDNVFVDAMHQNIYHYFKFILFQGKLIHLVYKVTSIN